MSKKTHKKQGLSSNYPLPLKQWRNDISVLLKELEEIRRQSQIVAQRLHLPLWGNYKEPETNQFTNLAAHFSDISLLCG